MSARPIAAYSFLPWARQGLGLNAREGDLDTTVPLRATLDVSLRLTGEPVSGNGTQEVSVGRPVQLYGPGDIVGIDARAIVRTEPRHWITNFETNFLPFVEFYEEDFPWRYTPAKPTPDGRRLRPWLALVVLEEAEFKEGSNLLNRPLPFIEVADAAQKFPPAEQLWAWAHVHVNGGLSSAPQDTAGLAAELDQTVRENRDHAYSRLMCPRILRENTAYHAFLVPTFEAGRLAGLGRDPAGAKFATQSAWEEYVGREESSLYPFYHRWYFRTSTVGDFEFLVRLLQPQTVDPRVGRRDMDVQRPAANLPGITRLGGVLRLGGALRAPLSTLSEQDLADFTAHEEWGKPYPHPFQTALAAFINLADDYASNGVAAAHAAIGLAGEGEEAEADEDPLIVPPIYGRWHAQTTRLVPADADPAKRHWVHELNHDPRHRVAAGFGTEVVKQNQEEFMEAAWQQVGKVLEANRKIRYALLAKLVSEVWHARELTAMRQAAPERFLSVATPVQRRVLAGGFTARHLLRQSTLPSAVLSKTARQALRPRGRAASLAGFDDARHAGNLLERVNRGEVSAAPPKEVAPVLPTGEKLAEQLGPRVTPGGLLELLRRIPWLRFLPLALALLLVAVLLFAFASALGPGGLVVLMAVGAALVGAAGMLTRRLGQQLSATRAADALRPETRTPASVEQLATSPDFRIGTPGRDPAPTVGAADSREAARFKESLRNVYASDVAERAIEIRRRVPLDLTTLASATLDGLRPARTIPARLLGSIAVPPRIRDQMVASPDGQAVAPLEEVMAYPEIDVPMYEPLKEMSSELFLPNLHLIPNNSITLLEPNQKFIESYMVGLNHEFARELLWREFPTDQRGSYFRQFWDVSGFLAGAPADPSALRERLRDIPELHLWSPDSGLDEHDHREAQGDKEDELVLVIRGELLKKYPTAVIYAHRADWERTADGSIDKTRPRKLAAPPDPGAANLPRDIVQTPLYEAQVAPDIYFFGFDLTAAEAKGGEIVNGEPDAGWFFVIKERPGEPRFGLDLPKPAPQPVINTWNDLAWTDVVNTFTPGAYLRPGERAAALTDPGVAVPALKQQFDEDSRFLWHADTHAAELAYILYQVPVLMAVHAVEMLKKIG